MVARSESMFGCYDSYSYRLWSLANVWSTYQFPSLANGAALKEDSGDASTNGGEYFIKCPQCQKGCASFQALKEHTETVHGGEDGTAAAAGASPPPAAVTGGPLACSQCSATFATRDQLEKHELLHSPNAPVSCKICQKTFANVYRLQRHMISHDESALLRKFKCTQCDKAFKFKHHLKEHIRIHSGEKPFECANCGKRFSHSGSYSSHMTSKKCLVMNLKMGGRTRAPGSNSVLDKSQTAKAKRPITSGPNLNNNITSSPNNNSFLPILPKYSEAAAAAFLSVMAPLDRNYQTPPSSATPLHPFYMPHLNGSAISPYTMPSLGHLFEQLHSNSPHRPPSFSDSIKDELKQLSENKTYSNNDDQNASKCDESTMDVDEKQQDNLDDRRSPGNGSNSGDLEAVKRILETVQATVNKQLLQASMQKLTSTPPPMSDSPPLEQKDSLKMCSDCNKTFDNLRDYDEHECCGNEQQVKVKSEGLAAKLEEAVTVKTEDASLNGVCSGTDEDEENTSVSRPHNEYDIDSESMTTGDHMSEDGRKVRVRSQIGDEQLAVLKEHYLMNPRPKREELVRIANQIGFPVRVVQVWFQNTRARDRREGRLVNVPYAPIHPASMMQFPNSVAPSSTTIPLPYHQPSSPHYLIAEQPLDLSTKKSHSSTVSSPASSPRRPVSATAHSESGEEAVNLSHKSSRSPTPYRQVPYQSMHYQSSNCSSDYHRSPSPGASENGSGNGSRLARILAQPAHRLAAMGGPMGILPVERLLHYTTPELNMAKSPLMTPASSSPGSDRRSWKMEENDDYNISHEMDHSEDDHSAKRMKAAQMAIKNLGNAAMPVSSTPESEAEGQFVCDQCDKAFSKQSSLARHKYEHSGQRPHKCDECPKAFKHKHHLTEHKRLHSGEKPFQCCKCLKRFSHSGSYSQHMNHRYSYCKPYRE